MQFDSLAFILFFALLAPLYWWTPTWGARKALLLIASYVFYAGWNPLFLPLLITTSIIDFRLALSMDRARGASRRLFLLAILAINLSVLGFFKYWNFFADNLALLLQAGGAEFAGFRSDIALPIGISFYTFHSLSYCIDIYRGRIEATRSMSDYLLYVAFFPQLVAGPIVRWTFMGPQIRERRTFDASRMTSGLCLMVLGLFQKIVLADAIFAPVANEVFGAVNNDGLAAWSGALAFTGQIFCDFAGYTTCAIGAALVLGFQLPVNFRSPYAATGFADFWRRWHISLSTWLRDYLYISMGGSRGSRIATYRNLMVTMLLGGLWHGAAWNFVIWGAMHGALLIGERLLLALPGAGRLLFHSPLRFAYRLLTFIAVVITWVYFRAESLADANSLTGTLLVTLADLPGLMTSASFEQLLSAGTLLALVLIHQWNRTRERALFETPGLIHGLLTGLMLAAIILTSGDGNAFIYFQF